MFTELKELELQIFDLLQKEKELKEKILFENAKFKKDETIMHELKINGRVVPGGVIEEVNLGGGYVKDHHGNLKFNDYWIYYDFRVFGEIETYLISEKELVKKLK